MDQTLALEIMGAGKSVLLSGPAGSGKTYVLAEFIRRAKSDGKHVSVTATTGLAATHLGGNTIHSWSGIGVSDELRDDFMDYLLKTRREIIEKTDILIIDEISMMHDYRLDMIDKIARAVRGDERPFGGIQVVLCGDFFQLPPVNRNDGRQGGFVIHSNAWEELEPVICYLQEQHRQDDQVLLEILNAMRSGDIRRNHAEKLLERVDIHLEGEVTELYTVNIDVDRINHERLAALPGDEQVYFMDTTGSENYVETLKRSCLAPSELILKKGAFVMFTKNATDRKYVNGTLAVVKGFDDLTKFPIVELKNGKTITVLPETWELRDGDKKRASLSQLPLRLAWAITVHKSQGMTLDAARMDLRKAFVEGMGYVALSRVRSLDTLSLLGINQMALRVSQDALEIDERLRQQSADAAKKYEHLREKAKERKPESQKKSSGWAEKIAKMRETYPNAYRPWSQGDDALLSQQFRLGNDIAALSKELGRHEGSIKMRLQKLFGEDVVQ